jgi:HCOMODA/2-hydroxy-3-carboxy-muconic semialdehyde decarboxylase
MHHVGVGRSVQSQPQAGSKKGDRTMRTFVLTVLITGGVLVTAQCSNMPVETSSPATAPPAPEVPAIIEDLVAANRIIADQGVVDGYGHVSVRNPDNPDQFFLSRSMAPESVVASDILVLDLDGNVLDSDQTTYRERYIHSEIYKRRPDVQSVVHSHAPSVVPFGTTTVPLRAMFHMSAFIGQGLPIFEIRNAAGMTDMLVSNQAIGEVLAETLGDRPAVLMRGHGAAIVGPSLPIAVGQSIYLAINAAMQAQAMGLGGPVTYLTPEEVELTGTPDNYQRAWTLWRQDALGEN